MLEMFTKASSPEEVMVTGILTIVVPTAVILIMSLFPAGSKFLSEVLGAKTE